MGRGSDSSWGWLLVVVFAAILIWSVLEAPSGNGTAPGSSYQMISAERGSAAPCEIPLPWHIAQLDPAFGLDWTEAEHAVREAVSLWENASGQALFPHSPGEGLAIRFVYDERQAAAIARHRSEELIATADADLDARRERLDRDTRRLDHDVEEFNTTVGAWNREGGAPPDVVASLERIESELQRRQHDLNRRIAALNREVEDRNATATEIAREFPARSVESGRYSEALYRRGARVVSVSEREISIFRFDDRDDLVVVIAHELGHALGLGHAPAVDAVMAAVHDGVRPVLHAADLTLLGARCPELVQ